MVEKRKTFKELEQGMGLAKDEAQGSMVLRMSPPPPTEAKPAKPASLLEGKAEKASEVPGPIAPTEIIDDMGVEYVPADKIVVEDDMGVFDFVGDVDLGGSSIEIRKAEPETKEAIDLVKAFKEGFAGSSSGLAYFEEIPKPRNLVFAEEVSHMFGHMLGETPSFALGMMIGGGPVSPLGMGGGFALSTATNKVLRESIQDVNKEMSDYYEGSTSPFAFNFNAKEWWEKFNDVLKESSKSYVVGATAGAAGKTIGTAAEMAEASSIVKNLSTVAAETVAMVQTQAFLEGRIPENEEYGLTAIGVGGARAALGGAKSLAQEIKQVKEFSADTGTRPFDIRFNEYFKRYSEAIPEEIKAPLKSEVGGIEVGGKKYKTIRETIEASKDRSSKSKKNALKALDAQDASIKAIEDAQKLTAEQFWVLARRNGWDRSGLFKEKIEEYYGEKGHLLIRDFVLSYGYQGQASVLVAKALERVDGSFLSRLSKEETKDLDQIIASRRTVEIDRHRNEKIESIEREIVEKNKEERSAENLANFVINQIDKGIEKASNELKAADQKKAQAYKEKGSNTKEEIGERAEVNKRVTARINKLKKERAERKEKFEETKKRIADELKTLSETKAEYPPIRHPYGLSLVEHKDVLNQLTKDHQHLVERADIYSEVMRDVLNEYLAEGLITPEAYTSMAEKGEHYSFRKFLDAFDPDMTQDTTSSGKDARGSGLKQLDEGSVDAMETDHRLLLAEVIKRAQRRIFNNRAAKRLYDLAVEAERQSDIKPEVARGEKEFFKLKEGNEPTPPEYAEIHAMVDGKMKTIFMRSDLAKEYKDAPPDDPTTYKILEAITLVRPLKMSATGLNPEFFVTNVPRDMFLMWGASKQYSPITPIGMIQLIKDMLVVTPDLALKRGRYEKAARDGMLQELLSIEGKPSLAKGGWKTFTDIISWHNTFFESLTRMALRERAIKNGMSEADAAYEARNILDYHQGGKLGPGLELLNPYTKAAIQGARATARYAKENPKMFAFKITQIGLSSAGFYLYNNSTPEMRKAYKDIPTEILSRFYIVLLPWFKEKDKGQTRMPYIRIAKDQGHAMFTPYFDYLAHKYLEWSTGEKFSFDNKQFIESAKVGFPPPITGFTGPPSVSAGLAMANYDDFFSSKIWYGPEVEKKEEFYDSTNPMTKWLGEMFGISPVRTERALGKIIATSNPLPNAFGYAANEIMRALDEKKKKEVFEEMTAYPGVRRLIKWTSRRDIADIEETRKVIVEENTEKLRTDRKLKEIAKIEDGEERRKQLKDVKSEAKDKKEKDRIKKRFGIIRSATKHLRRDANLKEFSTSGEIPHEAFLRELGKVRDPKKQAKLWFNFTQGQPKEDQKLLDSLLKKYRPRIIDESDKAKFKRALRELTQSKQGKGQ